MEMLYLCPQNELTYFVNDEEDNQYGMSGSCGDDSAGAVTNIGRGAIPPVYA